MAEYRQWRNENRTFLKDVVPLDAPYNMMLEVSSLCNAQCNYCAHSHKKKYFYGNMELQVFQRILEDLYDFPHPMKKCEMFGFGESLCNPNFAEMIRKVRETKMFEAIDFTTNGLLFTPKRVDDILAAGVDTIRISLQGLNAETYQRVCGVRMDFDVFVENLRYLYKHKGKCRICMKIADVAINEVKNKEKCLEDIFGEISDFLFIESIIPMFSSVDYEQIDENIVAHALHGRENVKQTEVHKVCHRPFYRMMIRANGDVTAACCDSIHDIVYGNIMRERLEDIWNGQKRKSFLRMQLEGKRFQHLVCKKCVLPNDITNQADIMDPWAEEILKRF